MRRSLLINVPAWIAVSILTLSGCSGAEEHTSSEKTVDTTVVAVAPIDTPATPVAAVPVPAPKEEQGKQVKEIKHSTQDSKSLDSIKKEKAKTRSNPVIEIKHGSQDDNLLDSIKRAKRKGKELKQRPGVNTRPLKLLDGYTI